MRLFFTPGRNFLLLMALNTTTILSAQNELKMFPTETDRRPASVEERMQLITLPPVLQPDVNLSANSLLIPVNTSNFNGNQRLLQEIKFPKLTYQYRYPDNVYGLYRLNSRSFISTSRTNQNFISLGGLSTAGATYNYLLNDVVSLRGGVSFSKYNMYRYFGNDVSFNGGLNLKLTDRASLHFFGNYSVPTSQNNDMRFNLLRGTYAPFYPSSGYGGAFEFKVTDSWGIMTGANREFDPFSRKWITRPFIMPVFYNK